MNKSLIAAAIAAGVLASPMSFAKSPKPPIADIIPQGCDVDATMLEADWDWENGTVQTKFGGDALFLVDVYFEENLIQEEYEVEFELDMYDAEDETSGVVVYACDSVTNATGSCSASMMGVDDAIEDVIVEEFGDDYTFEAVFDGVYVKAKNPGKNNGPQNYGLVDVCDDQVVIVSP